MFKGEIVTLLAAHVPLAPSAIAANLTTPPDPALGDLAFPCFPLAASLRRAPAAIAAELAAKLRGDGLPPFLDAAEAAGPYLNLRLNRPAATRRLLAAIAEAGDQWGGGTLGAGLTVCIDFCSPNVARRMHLGHLRSTVIGNALARIHAALGYRVVRINFLGDWGTQFGKLLVAWHRWGDQAALATDAIAELQRLYVRFHDEAKVNPALEDEARAAFKRLEEGDTGSLELWRFIREQTLQTIAKTLAVLGVSFDDFEDTNGEAYYQGRIQPVIEKLAALGLLVESDGAQVVPLDGLPPCLILKSDGATLYQTRDLAAAIHRHEVYQPAKSLYVVDLGQSVHFQQVFGVLAKMGEPCAPALRHVGFGVMTVGGKRLRTRAGDVVYLDDVLRQSIAMAQAELAARSPGMPGLDEAAQAIGAGAVIFNDLRQNLRHDIEYDPKEAISFDGETGPYVQYAHARCRNLLRKADVAAPLAAAVAAPVGDIEWALVTAVAQLPGAVETAADRCEPHHVARAVLAVAKALNRLYHDAPVLKAEPGVRELRLALVAAAAQSLRNGLGILGIETPPMRAE